MASPLSAGNWRPYAWSGELFSVLPPLALGLNFTCFSKRSEHFANTLEARGV